MMYLYYVYSHKASWQSTSQAPFITRTVQAHRVLKSWKESEATTVKRDRYNYWTKSYLGLDDTDANDCPTGEVKIYAGRPSGFGKLENLTTVYCSGLLMKMWMVVTQDLLVMLTLILKSILLL